MSGAQLSPGCSSFSTVASRVSPAVGTMQTEIGTGDVMLTEVTQEELDAEAEAADIDMQLEFEELDAEGCAIEHGSRAARALTARDAAIAAATGRLKAELHSLRDEIRATSGGVTAHAVFASRLNSQSWNQAETTVSALGITLPNPPAQAELQRALNAAYEETVWTWLHASAQHEELASCKQTLATNDTRSTARQWTHGLAIATSATEDLTCIEFMKELRATAARNGARRQKLRKCIAELRRACDIKRQLIELEAENTSLLQSLASLRQSCIDQHMDRAQFGGALGKAPRLIESPQDVTQLQQKIAMADARLQVVRQKIEDTGTAFIGAVPRRETAGTGPDSVAQVGSTRPNGQVKVVKSPPILVSTGTSCQTDMG